MQENQSRISSGAPLAGTRSGVSGVICIALALALIFGFAFGQLGPLDGWPFAGSPGVSTQATQTGADFYDAVDAYLATGQAATLRRLVQPDFIDHVAGAPATEGVEAFVRQLDNLRMVLSGARLTAQPMASSGDQVQFTVSTLPGQVSNVIGLPIALPPLTPTRETLRITAGHVAERWTDFQSPVTLSSLASIARDPRPASQLLPAIERVTMLHGSQLTLNLGTAHVILVESGALTIRGKRSGATANASTPDSIQSAWLDPFVALPGSTFLADESPYLIINEGPNVASALFIRIEGFAQPTDHPAFGPFGTSRNDAGVQIDSLSAALEIEDRIGSWTIEIARVTVAAGTAIRQHVVQGAELIFLEAGVLDSEVSECAKRCVQTIDGAGELALDRRAVHSAEGISASDGATTSYRVAGSTPATLLIVTVVKA